MDILSHISNMIVPRWVKITIASVLLSFVAIFVAMGYFGVIDRATNQGWIEASAYVLGIVLPILMLSLVVLFAQTGVSALRSRIHHYLATVLPDQAQILAPTTGQFVRVQALHGSQRRRFFSRGPVAAFAQAEDGLCIMNYAFYVPEISKEGGKTNRVYRRVMVRVELNVWKININICIANEIAVKLFGISPEQLGTVPLQSWEAIFQHTLAGSIAEGYQINKLPILRTFDGRGYVALVMSREMERDFMFSIAQKLYFAQDFMFMLRSLLSEKPEAFETVAKPS